MLSIKRLHANFKIREKPVCSDLVGKKKKTKYAIVKNYTQKGVIEQMFFNIF